MVQPGQLIRIPFRCPLIGIELHNNAWNWCRWFADKNSCLFCLGELYLDDFWYGTAVETMREMFLASPENKATKDHQIKLIRQLIDEELEKYKEIKGFKFLCPNGTDHVWIPEHACSYLETLQ